MFATFKRTSLLAVSLTFVMFVGFYEFNVAEDVMAASGTYTSDFDNALWKDANGSYDNRTDYSKAPFLIEETSQSFIFSSGYDDATNGPRLGSQNLATYAYHDFDHPALLPFRSLTTNTNEAVIVLATALVNQRITSFTFEYLLTSGGAQTIHYIQSLDDGNTWSLVGSGSTTGVLSLTFTQPIASVHVRLGILATYTAASYRYISNPRISYSYEDLGTGEASLLLAALVEDYTPCASDGDGLIVTTAAIAESLRQQYLDLAPAEQTSFDQSEAKSRFDFILSKHGLTTTQGIINLQVVDINHAAAWWLPITAVIGIMVYGTKRKTQA